MTEYPIPAFYFKVEYGKLEMSFQELTGIEAEMSSSSKNTKHSSIVLKRGFSLNRHLFESLAKTLSDVSSKLLTQKLKITLLNSNNEAIRIWECIDSYPNSIDLPLNEIDSNQIQIKKLSFNYNYIRRTL